MILMGWSGFSLRVGPNRCLPRGAFCVAEGNWMPKYCAGRGVRGTPCPRKFLLYFAKYIFLITKLTQKVYSSLKIR